MGGKTFMTVKEFYYATSLIGPILLSHSYEDIYGQDGTQEKIYSTASDLQYDFGHIGDYKVTHIQAIHGKLTLTIVKP